MKVRRFLSLAFCLLTLTSEVRAQAWPGKPLHVIVPYAAGTITLLPRHGQQGVRCPAFEPYIHGHAGEPAGCVEGPAEDEFGVQQEQGPGGELAYLDSSLLAEIERWVAGGELIDWLQ